MLNRLAGAGRQLATLRSARPTHDPRPSPSPAPLPLQNRFRISLYLTKNKHSPPTAAASTASPARCSTSWSAQVARHRRLIPGDVVDVARGRVGGLGRRGGRRGGEVVAPFATAAFVACRQGRRGRALRLPAGGREAGHSRSGARAQFAPGRARREEKKMSSSLGAHPFLPLQPALPLSSRASLFLFQQHGRARAHKHLSLYTQTHTHTPPNTLVFITRAAPPLPPPPARPPRPRARRRHARKTGRPGCLRARPAGAGRDAVRAAVRVHDGRRQADDGAEGSGRPVPGQAPALDDDEGGPRLGLCASILPAPAAAAAAAAAAAPPGPHEAGPGLAHDAVHARRRVVRPLARPDAARRVGDSRGDECDGGFCTRRLRAGAGCGQQARRRVGRQGQLGVPHQGDA